MRIRIPSMLRSYSNQQKYVIVSGNTLNEVFNNLEQLFQGIKFRFIDENNQIRAHMRLYVNGFIVDDLDMVISEEDEIFITQSLSGGS